MTKVTATKTEKLTHEQAVQIANEILRLESALSTMKDQLKQYVLDNGGEFNSGDTIWKFRESTKWEFRSGKSIEEFLYHIVKDGYTVSPYDYVSISGSKLKKLKLGEDYMTKFATKKVSASFVHTKA